MDAAAVKWQNERASIWWGAMLPNLKDAPDLETFAGIKPDKRKALARCVAAWDKVDLALRRNRNVA
jgi:hypothetical protein